MAIKQQELESIEKVLSCVRKDELIELVTDLVNIPSPGGREGPVGEFILQWLKRQGLETVRQVVAENRINAIGIARGTGGGPSLIFNGHTDTVLSGTDEDAAVLGRELMKPESQPRLYTKAGRLYGEGVYNDKGNVAAFLIAGKR